MHRLKELLHIPQATYCLVGRMRPLRIYPVLETAFIAALQPKLNGMRVPSNPLGGIASRDDQVFLRTARALLRSISLVSQRFLDEQGS